MTTFHAALLSNDAGRTATPTGRAAESSWLWQGPFETPAEARRLCKASLADGAATLAFVVREEDGVRTVAEVHPNAASQLIRHYRDFVADLESTP